MTSRATGATGATGDIQLAMAIREAYGQYVVFHSDHAIAERGALTLWTMHTWVYATGHTTPYILVTAPTSEAGKSTIFDVARCLVREPFPCVDPTPASLFHAIDMMHPTLMVDETDMIDYSAALKAVLNSGYQSGTPVIRAKKVYDVYCPKIFSGITTHRPPLRAATLSRCIQIPMQRMTREERANVRKIHPAKTRAELAPVYGALKEWAENNWERLAMADPAMPEELTSRQQDRWVPLIAIADTLGKTWGRAAREWAIELSAAEPRDPDPAVQILKDCRRVLDGWTGYRIPTRTLAELRDRLDHREYDEDLSPQRLSKRLAALGIHPETVPWRDGGRDALSVKGFVVRRGGKYTKPWAGAFERYDANGEPGKDADLR